MGAWQSALTPQQASTRDSIHPRQMANQRVLFIVQFTCCWRQTRTSRYNAAFSRVLHSFLSPQVDYAGLYAYAEVLLLQGNYRQCGSHPLRCAARGQGACAVKSPPTLHQEQPRVRCGGCRCCDTSRHGRAREGRINLYSREGRACAPSERQRGQAPTADRCRSGSSESTRCGTGCFFLLSRTVALYT